jgi:hypothetical protein
MEKVWIYYGFSGAISNFVVWISSDKSSIMGLKQWQSLIYKYL